MGEWGSLSGVIFDEGQNWVINPVFPKLFDRRIVGLDFGYSNDPTAALEISVCNGEIYLKELIYETKLLNSDIRAKLKIGSRAVVADSAEPKSIAELKKLGLNIYPAQKGKDSINNGINLIKEFKVNVSPDSINLIKELRNYVWAKDKYDNQLTKPIDDFNHLIDAFRYGMFFLMNRKIIKFI